MDPKISSKLIKAETSNRECHALNCQKCFNQKKAKLSASNKLVVNTKSESNNRQKLKYKIPDEKSKKTTKQVVKGFSETVQSDESNTSHRSINSSSNRSQNSNTRLTKPLNPYKNFDYSYNDSWNGSTKIDYVKSLQKNITKSGQNKFSDQIKHDPAYLFAPLFQIEPNQPFLADFNNPETKESIDSFVFTHSKKLSSDDSKKSCSTIIDHHSSFNRSNKCRLVEYERDRDLPLNQDDLSLDLEKIKLGESDASQPISHKQAYFVESLSNDNDANEDFLVLNHLNQHNDKCSKASSENVCGHIRLVCDKCVENVNLKTFKLYHLDLIDQS
jgi:hypothetical protein